MCGFCADEFAVITGFNRDKLITPPCCFCADNCLRALGVPRTPDLPASSGEWFVPVNKPFYGWAKSCRLSGDFPGTTCY